MLTFVAVLALQGAPAPPPAQARPFEARPFEALRAEFEHAFEQHDDAACEALWKSAGALVLPLIDADLEGSLKVLESSASPDRARVELLRSRAVWGAEIAARVRSHPILLDYATAFVGWKDEQYLEFRGGQKAYRDASRALGAAHDARKALELAESCCAHAGLLGDWWGLEMGHTVRGAALQQLARLAEALEAFATARLLAHDLGLADDELECAQKVADLGFALGHDQRALAAAQDGVALATSLAQADTLLALLEREAQLEERLGRKDAAQRTRARAAAAATPKK